MKAFDGLSKSLSLVLRWERRHLRVFGSIIVFAIFGSDSQPARIVGGFWGSSQNKFTV